MDELDLLWDEIIAYDPAYVDQYDKHEWRKDILEDDSFLRDMFAQSKTRGFSSLKNFKGVEDYYNKIHGVESESAPEDRQDRARDVSHHLQQQLEIVEGRNR